MRNINWIKNLKKNMNIFLGKISEDDYEYIKYSLSGDIYDKRTKWGLGQNVFIVKVLFMLDLLKDISVEKRNNLIRNLKKFQDKDGYISDPLIRKLITKNKFIFFKEKTNVNEVEKNKKSSNKTIIFCP